MDSIGLKWKSVQFLGSTSQLPLRLCVKPNANRIKAGLTQRRKGFVEVLIE
jgi:hypothetical protein